MFLENSKKYARFFIHVPLQSEFWTLKYFGVSNVTLIHNSAFDDQLSKFSGNTSYIRACIRAKIPGGHSTVKSPKNTYFPYFLKVNLGIVNWSQKIPGGHVPPWPPFLCRPCFFVCTYSIIIVQTYYQIIFSINHQFQFQKYLHR